MKKILPVALLFFMLKVNHLPAQPAPPKNHGPAFIYNYVRTCTPSAPLSDTSGLASRSLKEVKVTTQYADGLGRPFQTVIRQGAMSTGGEPTDLVSPVILNEHGREQYRLQPFAAGAAGQNPSISDGGIKLNVLEQYQSFMQQQYGYQGDTMFYGKNEFEFSPLNRSLKTMPPGNNWAGSNRGTAIKYWFNTDADSVRAWQASLAPAGEWGTYTSTGAYAPGQLYKVITTDEEGQQTIEFKDKEGKLVLKKLQISAPPDSGSGASHTGWICTYYIYDRLNSLRCVIQPEGVKWLCQHGWSFSAPGAAEILNEQCFRYEYDSHGRLVMKKIPGAEVAYLVYDARNRLVMTQDAGLRPQNQWMVSRYDAFNRLTETGIWVNANAFITHLQAADTSAAYPQVAGSYEVMIVRHYDDYSDLPATLPSFQPEPETYFAATDNNNWPYPQHPAPATAVKGMMTWSSTRILGTADWIHAVSYFDEKERVIQKQSTNITGGTNITATQYNWAGQQLLTVNVQQDFPQGATPQQHTLITGYAYDDLGRLLQLRKTIRSQVAGINIEQPEQLLFSNSYNAQGQLVQKILAPSYVGPAGQGLQTLHYEYNIRGWLLGMNRDFVSGSEPAPGISGGNHFGFELRYDKTSFTEASLAAGSGPKYFNGNIGGVLWKSYGDEALRKYDFSYDPVNRILGADFSQYTGGSFNQSAGINYDIKMGNGTDASTAYDDNGNILRQQQWGLTLTGSRQIDDMMYAYRPASNKLAGVTEYATGGASSSAAGLGDFKDGHPAGDDYQYDASGSMVQDLNKDISHITYNHLHLPVVITVAPSSAEGGAITYTYDAAGNKLKKEVNENGQPPKITYYAGLAVYENEQLQFFSHEEGRARYLPPAGRFAEGAFAYDYMLRDHLGSVRMVLTEAVQKDEYPAATMEENSRPVEESIYANLPETRSPQPEGYPEDQLTDPNDNVAKTGGSTGPRIGPSLLLKVMAGDQFNIRVSSYWNGVAGTQSAPAPLAELAGAFLTSAGQLPSGHLDATALPGHAGLNTGLMSFLATQPASDGSRPAAFVNWVFFDEQLRWVEQGSGFEQAGPAGELVQHFLTDIPAARNGYLFIYVSNTDALTPVYFDNLQVTHTRGPLLEENHYYPFGLLMQGISSRALNILSPKNNKNTFQNQEFTDELDVNYYEFRFRSADPQTGRFLQVDPLSDKFVHNSVYAFSENKVTSHVELEGLEAVSIEELYKCGTDFSGSISGQGMINNPLVVSNRINRVESGPGDPLKLGVVLHRTVSSNSKSTLGNFAKTGSGTHFLVGKDGTIYQTASLNKGTFHFRPDLQTAQFQLTRANTISIEVVGMPLDANGKVTLIGSKVVGWEPLTEPQIKSVAFLVNSLISTFGLTNNDIYNHEDIQSKAKNEGRFVYESIQAYLNPDNNAMPSHEYESSSSAPTEDVIKERNGSHRE